MEAGGEMEVEGEGADGRAAGEGVANEEGRSGGSEEGGVKPHSSAW